MNAIIETPYYNDFCKWLTNGKPRNAAGKPTPARTKPVAIAAPVAPTQQRAAPAAPKTTGRNPNSNNGRVKSEAGAAARAFIAKATERPNPVQVARMFGLSREHAYELVKRKFGKVKISETGRFAALTRHLATLTERPSPSDMASRFSVSLPTASRGISERFGNRMPSHNQAKAEAEAWVATLTERPPTQAVQDRFGLKRDTARRVIVDKFGGGRGGRKARLEAVAQ